MVQAPGFIRGINPKSKIENPQAPAFIRGVNLKSKIENLKSIDLSLMSSVKPLIIITCRFFIDRHWAGGIIKFGSTNMATDLIRQIVVAVLLLAIAHSSYLSGNNCPRSTSRNFGY
jgi:hypothetical protein